MRTLWGLLCAMFLSGQLVASSAIVEFSDESLRVRYQQLIQELRCPKCQNQNLADSNAPISQDLRAQVQGLLEEGMSDRQIKDYLKARYSDFILYRPEVNKTTWLLWAAPVLFMFIGAWVVYSLYRQKNTPKSVVASADAVAEPESEESDDIAMSATDQQRLEQLLMDGEEQ
ncbi:MAG: cytochrome C biogenesis protein cycl [Porticoccaceae bacterium]|nr:cytochrome C biogenesis protein cycl [Porticoccaceae bacterium]